ncbi:MAG: DMT family transporter [Candidatus Eremiobacteraeota bacterium]|nr:DMT family transporter [Candidatus Eremiobacteraeota bacterium]
MPLVYLGLLYVVACWGLNTVLVKSAITMFNPVAFTTIRFLAMTPLAFALVYASGQRPSIRREDLPALIVCAALGYGIYQFLWILGLANTTAFANSLFGSMSPIFTLGIVALMGQERVRHLRWAGAGIALFGVAVFEGALAGRATFRLGDVLSLLSAVCFAGYNISASRLVNRYSPVVLVAVTMTIGTLMILPIGAPQLLHTNLRQFGWAVWGPFAFAVLFPIVLTWPVWNYGIARLGAARTSLFGFLVPIIAGIISVPILGARFEAHQIIGAALCLGGMALAVPAGRAPTAVRTEP